jgi:hypothetical protein
MPHQWLRDAESFMMKMHVLIYYSIDFITYVEYGSKIADHFYFKESFKKIIEIVVKGENEV